MCRPDVGDVSAVFHGVTGIIPNRRPNGPIIATPGNQRGAHQGGCHGGECLQGNRDRRLQRQIVEKAASAAIERASNSLRDLRIAEVVEQDLHIEDGKISAYRIRLKISFKFEEAA